jgi:hypothetical protein
VVVIIDINFFNLTNFNFMYFDYELEEELFIKGNYFIFNLRYYFLNNSNCSNEEMKYPEGSQKKHGTKITFDHEPSLNC